MNRVVAKNVSPSIVSPGAFLKARANVCVLPRKSHEPIGTDASDAGGWISRWPAESYTNSPGASKAASQPSIK
eukprot:6927305-Prymnesium_polylepis.1